MGSGGFHDAAFDLRADVAAGTYHVACDSIILGSVDVTFTLIWRHGGSDTELAQWTRHWDPLPGGGYEAQAYELDVAAPAVSFTPGDQLVFRYQGDHGLDDAFIPNGDGARTHGRIPSITLP